MTHVRGTTVLAVLVACCSGLASAADVRDADAGRSGTAFDQTATEVDDRNADAMRQFEDEVFGILAASGTTDGLLAAAMHVSLSEELRKDQPSPRMELLRRAQAQAPDDVLVQWAIAANACPVGDARCDAGPAIARLIELDAGNAYPWIMELTRAQRAGDASRVRVALGKAAQAERFDDYALAVSNRLTRTLMTVPELPIEARIAMPGVPGWKGLRVAAANGITLAFAIPSIGELSILCGPGKGSATTLDVRRDCLALADLQMRTSPSSISWFVGSGIAKRLLPDAAERATIERAIREQDYRLREFGLLMEVAFEDPAQSDGVIERRLASTNELATMADELRRAGIALTPPDDWNPTR
jgi:hypothetical protein